MRWLPVALGVLLLAAPAGAGTLAPSKCTAQKWQAAAAYAKRRAACESKAAAKGIPVEASCLTSALARLQKAFEKSEGKTDCPVTGNVDLFANETDTYFEHVAEILTTPPVCCATPGVTAQCFYTLGTAACSAAGGTVGAADTVCRGAGACQVPPVTGGACCETEDGCVTGAIEDFQCDAMGGEFSDDALCLPSGDCVPET